MQLLKHIVHYKLPGQLQWESEHPSKDAAMHFIAEVESQGGIAIYVEDYEEDDIQIGSVDQGDDDEEEN